MNVRLNLSLLPSGDIEIYQVNDVVFVIRVYHRSYNVGDDLRKNLLEAYDAFLELERSLNEYGC